LSSAGWTQRLGWACERATRLRGRLIGLESVASVALGLALAAPFIVWFVDRSLATRDALARLTGATG